MDRNFLTITELAKRLRVSRTRVIELIDTYGVQVNRISPRVLLITEEEAAKIPADRPPGRPRKSQDGS